MIVFKNILVLLLTTLVLSSCIFNSPKSTGNTAESTLQTSEPDQTSQLDIKVQLTAEQDNTNAFELSKSNLDLLYKEYDFGVFITEINGTQADDSHFWALYLNNEFAEKSVDQLILNKGDLIEWRYEEIM